MSFFLTSDNKPIETTGEMEMGGGSEPIPEGTQLKVAMDEIKWDEFEEDQFINARWTVIDGDYKNRKVFHKIRVMDKDSKKKDKALRMLAAIDANAGGHIAKLGTSPNDMELASALLNKPMAIKVGVWEMNDRKGNWVMSVSPLNAKPAPTPSASSTPIDVDDDIGF